MLMQGTRCRYLHQKKVQHRDLKSLNILLQTEAGALRAKVGPAVLVSAYH